MVQFFMTKISMSPQQFGMDRCSLLADMPFCFIFYIIVLFHFFIAFSFGKNVVNA